MTSEVKRATNFNSKEESVLLYLVKQYKMVIENKKTDSNINKEKIKCWKSIEQKFNNEIGGVFRDHQTLRKKYENIKKRTKKKVADEKCYTLGTGGGPAKKPPVLSDIDVEIKEILGERIDGLPSAFGGDAGYSLKYQTTFFLFPVLWEIITIINDSVQNDGSNASYDIAENNMDLSAAEANNPVDTEHFWQQYSEAENTYPSLNKEDWSKNTVENLRTPKTQALIPGDKPSKKKRNEYDALCSKVTHWAGVKSNVESEKIKYIEEEHTIKIKCIKQKYETEIELMKKESDAKIKRLDEEMEITLEGIKEQNKIKKEILLLEKHLIIQKIQQNSQ